MEEDSSHSSGIFRGEKMTKRQTSILHRMGSFYDEGKVDDILLPFVTQRSPISLRSLDWLVTNYSKKKGVYCKTLSGSTFNIHQGYKLALSHFRRRNFDCFRRRQRIRFLHKGEEFETTVAQCNFLSWAHQNGVLDYAIRNSTCIEKDMNEASSLHKEEKKTLKAQGKRVKRKEITHAPSRKCAVLSKDTLVSFSV